MRRVVVAAMLIGALGSCVRIPPRRSLPNTINALYIPMFANKSYEPGLEELLTRATQEEFLSDGRLDVVSRSNADAVLAGTILSFDITPHVFTRDDFPLSSQISLKVDVALYDPADRERQKPLMTWSDVGLAYPFLSDMRLQTRAIETTPDVDPKEYALRYLAREIVFAVINRAPTTRGDIPGAPGLKPTPALPQKVLGREKIDTRFQDIRSSEPVPVEEPVKTKSPETIMPPARYY